jgi:hypothetical protein
MSNDAKKDEIAKRAAQAQLESIHWEFPDTQNQMRAWFEEAAYRALSDYAALRETSEEGAKR